MSLRARLLWTLGLTLTLLWGVTAVWLLRDLHQQVEHTLDQRLAQSARMVAGLVSQLPDEVWQQAEHRRLSIPAIKGLACQVNSPSGEIIAQTHTDLDGVLTPRQTGHSYRTEDGVKWRVFTYQHDDLTITTADRVEERNLLLTDVLMAATVPFLFALTGSLAALWLGILRGLHPLSRLKQALAQRHPEALAPIEIPDLPAELRPLVATLNALLGRVQQAFVREQRFTNDAAHELRTPLTAIKTHLQVASRQHGEASRFALTQAEKGVSRLQGTLEQLLMLARLENGLDDAWQTHCLARSAAMDALLMLGEEEQVTFTITWPDETLYLPAPHELVVTALRNLLENAHRFSPDPGSVQVSFNQSGSGLAIEIRDQGPGVSDRDLPRLAERFWRHGTGHGSGLGLAIVSAIAERFSGRLSFTHNAPHGLLAQLWFPLVEERHRAEQPDVAWGTPVAPHQ